MNVSMNFHHIAEIHVSEESTLSEDTVLRRIMLVAADGQRVEISCFAPYGGTQVVLTGGPAYGLLETEITPPPKEVECD